MAHNFNMSNNQYDFFGNLINNQYDIYGYPINNQYDIYGNQINNFQQNAIQNIKNLPFEANEKEKAMILELIKLLLAHGGNLTKTNVANDSVLSLSYAMPNDRYFKMWIFYLDKIALLAGGSGKSLLRKMINDKKHNILSLTLKKCDINDGDVQYLLTLAVKALKQQDMDAYQIIVEACPNRNILIKEGETFLTYLLKTDDDEATFKLIVESRYFDLNVVNKLGETALIVACQKLKPVIVKLLLDFGSDVTYKNYFAVETTLVAKLNNPTPDNEVIANQIMKHLMNKSAPLKANLKLNTQKRLRETLSREGIFCFDKKTDILPIIHLMWKHHCDLVKLLENNENILLLTYNLVDKSYFKCLLENVHGPLRIFSNEAGVKLLLKMSSEHNWNDLSTLLDLSVIEKTSNIDLLSLALDVLKKPELKTYEKIIDKCTDVNIFMTGGETFLTNLFKHNIEEKVIEVVIKSKVFDIKILNEKDETVLMLACSRLMESIVTFLLNEGCDISHRNYGAISMTVLSNKTKILEEAEKKKKQIFDLFFRNNKSIECRVKRETNSKISSAIQNAIPGKTLIGNNMGIECSSKTNFLESIIISLFAKSDNLDFIFDPIIEEKNCFKEKKDVMAWKIVYALREFGYVGSDRMDELAKTCKEVNIDEIDDFLIFFCDIWPKESLLSLLSYENITSHCMTLKLFVELENGLDYITSQELLDISMIQNKLMFMKVSTCLIVEAVRDSKSLLSYKYIIPSKRIEISNVNFKSFKKCHHCKMTAAWQCPQCIITNGIEITKGLFCNSHKCDHTGILTLPQCERQSLSYVPLKLSSIICKANGRYFSYVNQKGISKDWFLYETVTEENSYVPKSSFDKEISEFLNLEEKEMKNSIMKSPFDKLANMLKQSCIFIYDNDAVTCY